MTTTGAIDIAIVASIAFRIYRITMMMRIIRIWLTRLSDSVTTFANSSESEVTRLTILPDGFLSKNERSRFIMAPKASSRSLSTTLPTTCALCQERTKLNTHAKTPVPRIPANHSQRVRVSNVSSVIRSRPHAATTGVSIIMIEFITIMMVVRIIRRVSGLK